LAFGAVGALREQPNKQQPDAPPIPAQIGVRKQQQHKPIFLRNGDDDLPQFLDEKFTLFFLLGSSFYNTRIVPVPVPVPGISYIHIDQLMHIEQFFFFIFMVRS